jgi:hypothetical protein
VTIAAICTILNLTFALSVHNASADEIFDPRLSASFCLMNLSIMSIKHLRPIFKSCDVILQNLSDGRIMILSNELGCGEVQKLFPEIPFDWRREGLDSLPRDWSWIALVPQRVSEAHPPDLFEISLWLLRARTRVVVAEPDSYKFLHTEADIQSFRKDHH